MGLWSPALPRVLQCHGLCREQRSAPGDPGVGWSWRRRDIGSLRSHRAPEGLDLGGASLSAPALCLSHDEFTESCFGLEGS